MEKEKGRRAGKNAPDINFWLRPWAYTSEVTWGQEIRSNQMNFPPAAATLSLIRLTSLFHEPRESLEKSSPARRRLALRVSVAACSLTLNYGAGEHQQPRTDER